MKRFDRRILNVTLIFVLLACFLAEPFSRSTSAQIPADTVIARVKISNDAELNRFLTLGLDVLEMREGSDLFILSTFDQVESLRAKGWAVTVDKEQTAIIGKQGIETFMGGYRTVVEMRAFLEGQAAQYPNLAEFFVYGQSWEKTTSGGAAGYDLFGIKLTNKQRSRSQANFLFSGRRSRTGTYNIRTRAAPG